MTGGTITYSVAKTIHAPLPFVFRWCTDFRDDDPKLFGSQAKNTVLERTPSRVVYKTEVMRDGTLISTRSVVSLSPPDRWHVDAVGTDREYTGDYKLTSQGQDTLFKVDFAWTSKGGVPRTAEERQSGSSNMWDKFVKALEADYQSAQCTAPASMP